MTKHNGKRPDVLTTKTVEDRISELVVALDKLNQQIKGCEHCAKKKDCSHRLEREQLQEKLEDIKQK